MNNTTQCVSSQICDCSFSLTDSHSSQNKTSQTSPETVRGSNPQFGTRDSLRIKFASLSRTESLERLQAVQQSITLIPRMRNCLKHVAYRSAPQLVEYENGEVEVAGLARCEGTTCVNCMRIRAHEHSQKIEGILTGARSKGHRLFFATFGLNSRNNGNDLSNFYSKLVEVNQKTFSKKYRTKARIHAMIKSVDFTLTKRQVNFHYHMILIMESDFQGNTDELYSDVYGRWATYAVKAGKTTSYSGNHMVEIAKSEALSKYMAKTFNALELVSADRDTKNQFSYTLPGLIAEIEKTGDTQLIKIYRRLESTLKGKRQIAYTKNCKALAVEIEETEDVRVIKESIQMSRTLWSVFSGLKSILRRIMVLSGMSKEYFKTLCALDRDEPLSVEDLKDHKRVLIKAYHRDLRQIGLKQPN